MGGGVRWGGEWGVGCVCVCVCICVCVCVCVCVSVFLLFFSPGFFSGFLFAFRLFSDACGEDVELKGPPARSTHQQNLRSAAGTLHIIIAPIHLF